MSLSDSSTLKDKYKIIRLLGQGGMAQVWLAEEITFRNRQVAIKVPLPGLSPEESHILQARFKREVDVCAELAKAKTPHIVQALTAEPYEEGNILVLEYMPGGDLATRIQQNPNGMPIDTAIKIASEVLSALDSVHNHPLAITHRDIKPSNILFNAKDEACLGDFGLAQMGRSSGTLTSLLGNQSIASTPLYCAPELNVPGAVALPSTDIYSFGCVLFEMLTGTLYKQVRPGTPPSILRSNVPGWLDHLVVRATLLDQWDRLQSTSSLLSIFHEERTPTPPSLPPKPPNDYKRIAAVEDLIKEDPLKARRELEKLKKEGITPPENLIESLTNKENEINEKRTQEESKIKGKKVEDLYQEWKLTYPIDVSQSKRIIQQISELVPDHHYIINIENKIKQTKKKEIRKRKKEDLTRNLSNWWFNHGSVTIFILFALLFTAWVLGGMLGFIPPPWEWGR